MAFPVATPTVTGTRSRLRICLNGIVQGVGFRPFVHRRATQLGLAGWVANSTQGVTIEVEGQRGLLDQFVRSIQAAPPTNAVVTSIEIEDLPPRGEVAFSVLDSETAGARSTQVVPDLATCDECLEELFDPNDRRYRYPFINCTSCGPRYSIVESLPYDRGRTTMRGFEMCAMCRNEYQDPAHRRFHAEPNACPECGPQIFLWDSSGKQLVSRDKALLATVAALRKGRIVAVKGIGGFHLLVDAGNETAVRRLRAAKRREEKPFAVMFPTLTDVREQCTVSVEEETLLCERARPIVLLRNTGTAIASSVAPGNARLGALLPYSPLHYLLMHELRMPVVATSGNLSDEPIVSDETAVVERLRGVADLFLVHDRPIVRPLDDSVAQVVLGAPQLLRRARGYAPAPIAAGNLATGIVAYGSHVKATVAVTCGAGTVLSHHIGDLETVAARSAYDTASADIVRLFGVRPRLAACDLHPDYASSQAAQTSDLPVVAVQHHVAHVAACMAEHSLVPPVLGVAWDGVGYGTDGALWGGEFLGIDETGWHRVAHLRPFRLPGGEAAVREPARAALGLLFTAYGDGAVGMTDLAPVARFTRSERAVILRMLVHDINSPVTTSAGRLFDAFAALCRLQQRSGYEGQAAAALEWCATDCDESGGYVLPVCETAQGPLMVDWEPALTAALADLRSGKPAGAVSASLHGALARAIADVAKLLGAQRVVLTGGCFQNILLTEKAVAELRAVGCEPFWHRRVPPNDGGIAFGQAVWAAWSEQRGR